MYWNAQKKLTLRWNLRLIETWDVLKLELSKVYIVGIRRLIETWDVLKCFCPILGDTSFPD